MMPASFLGIDVLAAFGISGQFPFLDDVLPYWPVSSVPSNITSSSLAFLAVTVLPYAVALASRMSESLRGPERDDTLGVVVARVREARARRSG